MHLHCCGFYTVTTLQCTNYQEKIYIESEITLGNVYTSLYRKFAFPIQPIQRLQQQSLIIKIVSFPAIANQILIANSKYAITSDHLAIISRKPIESFAQKILISAFHHRGAKTPPRPSCFINETRRSRAKISNAQQPKLSNQAKQ